MTFKTFSGLFLAVPFSISLTLAAARVLAQSGQDQADQPPTDTPVQMIEAEIDSASDAPPALTPAEELALQAEQAAAQEAATAQPASRPRQTAAPVAVQMLTVRQVVTGQSAYLTEAEIATVRAALFGQRLSVADAARLADGFNALYASKGIALASATVAAIDTRTGEVRIAFNEPVIRNVRVEDGDLASGAVYARRLALQQGALADTREIAERQLRLQRLSGVVLDLTTVEGEGDGAVDLVFTPLEPPARSFAASLDNHGNRSTGRERLILSYSETSLTGNLDPLSVSVTLARGVRSVAGGYALPLTADGVSLFASGSLERTRSIIGPAQTSRSSNFELGVSVPIVVTAENQLVVRGSIQRFQERRRTEGVLTTDQRGTGFALGATATRFFDGGALSYDQSLRHIRWTDGLFQGGRTTILAGEGSALVALGPDWQLLGRLGWQTVIGSNNPAAFRSTLSSPSRVRGYDNAVSAGDAFYFGSVQVQRSTPWQLSEGRELSLFPFAFVDMGRAYERAGGTWTAQDTLLSVGIGSAIQLGQRSFGEMVLAMPLRDANGFAARGRVRADLRLGIRF